MNENIKPRYEVHKLEGTKPRRFAVPKTDKDGKLIGGFDYDEKEVDAGWMVYFPSGASVHVWTEEEMDRQGFLNRPSLVNMETGDDVGQMSDTSLKSKSEQVSNRSRSSKVAQI
jgi:hypothetical protein